MFKYWGFGLNIVSEIEFPELLSTEFEDADLEITFGKVPLPERLPELEWEEFKLYIASDLVIFEAKDSCRFLAGGGKRILAEPLVETDVHDLRFMRIFRLHILASMSAAILVQRGLIPMHASAIIHADQLVLLAGDAGAGKSTSLTALHKAGFKIFSDDIVALNLDEYNNALTASASYPMVKLWDDSIGKLNYEKFADRSFNIKEGMSKYGLFFHDDFIRDSKTVSMIVLLRKKVHGAVEVNRISEQTAFINLRNQVYRPMFINSTALKRLAMKSVAALVKDCPIYEVHRPDSCDPAELALSIIHLINSQEQ